MKDRPSDLRVKGEASPVVYFPAPMSASFLQKHNFRFALIVNAFIVLLIVGVAVFVIYQNNAKSEKAHNAYLSSLSGNGTLVFSDPLREESQSQWSTSTGNTGTCQFEGNAYHIKQQSNSFVICDARGTYRNFAFEVQLTITQGGCGGIVFRERNNGEGLFYYFHICQTGSYDVTRYANYGGFQQLPYGDSSAIHSGLGKPNTIAVKAVGNAMTFYANEQQIAQAQDDGYAEGSIGLAAYPPGLNDGSEIAYTNARLWTL